MFEKLLSLLLQAKGGAVATVFVLGTSGALVTATVENGLTTITIAETAATTTASETTQGGSTTTNTTVTEAILALFNRTSAEEDPTSTATAKGCSDEAHARNEQMKRVNEASKDAREDVKALGRDAGKSADAKELVRDADTEIKDLRQAAVKDIHGTFDCDKDEDETGTTSGTSDGTTTTTTNEDDAEAIADEAVEAMEKVVEELEAALEGLEDEAADEDDSDEATTTSNEKQNGKSDKAKNDKSKDKGNGKGRN